MNKPPGRHDITIRVAKQAGRHPDPAAFAAAASQAAAGRDASILSAHTAEEIICVVSVPAATGAHAAAVWAAIAQAHAVLALAAATAVGGSGADSRIGRRRRVRVRIRPR